MSPTHQSPSATQERFLSLLSTHERALHKVCWAYAQTPQDREDIFQEIVSELWDSFPRYDPARPFSTWMVRVALNVAIDARRRARRRTRERTDPAALDAQAAGTSRGRDEPLEELRRLLDSLPDADRALLLLHLEGFAHREIADVLGISESNVGTRLSRLRERLRRSADEPTHPTHPKEATR